jgi:hypothetical protein
MVGGGVGVGVAHDLVFLLDGRGVRLGLRLRPRLRPRLRLRPRPRLRPRLRRRLRLTQS